jgi:hypothetical protein
MLLLYVIDSSVKTGDEDKIGKDADLRDVSLLFVASSPTLVAFGIGFLVNIQTMYEHKYKCIHIYIYIYMCISAL